MESWCKEPAVSACGNGPLGMRKESSEAQDLLRSSTCIALRYLLLRCPCAGRRAVLRVMVSDSHCDPWSGKLAALYILHTSPTRLPSFSRVPLPSLMQFPPQQSDSSSLPNPPSQSPAPAPRATTAPHDLRLAHHHQHSHSNKSP